MMFSSGVCGCNCGSPGPCNHPVTISFCIRGCPSLATSPAPVITLTGPGISGSATIQSAHPGPHDQCYGTGGYWVAYYTSPTAGVFSYKITSPTTFDHYGSQQIVCNDPTGGANSIGAVLTSRFVQWHVNGCAKGVGATVSIASQDGLAHGAGITDAQDNVTVYLGGSEPTTDQWIVTVTAPTFQTVSGTIQGGYGGLCSGYTDLHAIDCHQCYSLDSANNVSIGQYGLGPGDPGCTQAQPTTGTFQTPWGASFCTGIFNQTPRPQPVSLGTVSGRGFTWATQQGSDYATCKQTPHPIQVAVYGGWTDGQDGDRRNVFTLSFQGRQRCDPTDSCTYPEEDNPNSPWNITVEVVLTHQPGSCSPAVLTGTYVSPTCNQSPNGNYTEGADYSFLEGTYTYTLDNCGCSGSTDPYTNSDAGGTGTDSYPAANARALAMPPRRPTARVALAPRAVGSPPRVGFVAPCLRRGGAESWQLTLARATDVRLAWQGAAVLGAADDADPGAVAEARALFPVHFGPDAVALLASQCDVLISWAVEDLGPILAAVTPRPRLIYCDHLPHSAVYGDLARQCFRAVDHLVGVSPLCAPGFPPEFAGRTTIIPNGVDPARLRPSAGRPATRLALGIPAAAPVAGYLGRLSPEKDPEAMLRLAAALPEPWHVVVAGDGDLGPALATQAAAAGLDRLHLVGSVSAGDLLSAVDVLVVPSRYESFGLSLAEGLLVGLPVVAPPVGLASLHPDLVEPIPPNASGPVLAAAVVRARIIGPRPGARARVRDLADPERFARAWIDLVHRLDPAGAPTPLWDPAVLAAIRACPHGGAGGPALSLSPAERAGCGCGSAELYSCRIGRGRIAGRVTSRDCYACQASQLATAPTQPLTA